MGIPPWPPLYRLLTVRVGWTFYLKRFKLKKEGEIMKNRFAILAIVLATVVAMTPVAKAADKTICFVTFSLQVGYFQSSVAGGKAAANLLEACGKVHRHG